MNERSDPGVPHSAILGDLAHFTGRGLPAACPVCRAAIGAEDRGVCPRCRRVTASVVPGMRPAGLVCFLAFTLLFGALSGFSVFASFFVLYSSGPYGHEFDSYGMLTAALTVLTGWVLGFSMHGVLCSLAFLQEVRARVILTVLKDLVTVLIPTVTMVWLLERQTGIFWY